MHRYLRPPRPSADVFSAYIVRIKRTRSTTCPKVLPMAFTPLDACRQVWFVIKRLARPTGVEPVTSAFGGQHSIQLSYGRFEGSKAYRWGRS